MRKLLAIALLAVFGLPFASSLFALTPRSDATLPACCRRAGKHQCGIKLAHRDPRRADEPLFAAALETCPYSPAVLGLSHQPKVLGMPSGQVVFSGLTGRAAVIGQAESKRRISRDRSRQKRGPPCPILL